MNRILISIVILVMILGIVGVSITSNLLTDYQLEKNLSLPMDTNFDRVFNISLDNTIISTPLVEGNIIYVQTEHNVISYDSNLKKVIWAFRMEGNYRNPSMVKSGSVLYVPANKEILYAINSSDGSLLWQVDFSIGDFSEYFDDIAASEEQVFAVVHNSFLFSVDANTGDIRWKTPVISRAKVFIDLNQDQLILLGGDCIKSYNAENGKEKWTKLVNNYISAYTLQERKLWVTTYNSNQNLLQIDLNNGSIAHKYTIAMNRVFSMKSEGDSLYIAGDGLIKFESLSGEIAWENYEIDELTTPVFFEGKIFIRKNSRNLYIFNSEMGKLESRFSLTWFSPYSMERSIDPIEIENMILLPTNKKGLSAFLYH